MTRKTAPPGRAWMNLTLPAFGLALTLIALVIAIAISLGGCALPGPAKLITFEGGSNPSTTGYLVVIDIVFTRGTTVKDEISYPHEWPGETGLFTHHHAAGAGTIIHMSIKVFATEPGQLVSCSILIDGAVVDASPPVKNYALCIGPPV